MAGRLVAGAFVAVPVAACAVPGWAAEPSAALVTVTGPTGVTVGLGASEVAALPAMHVSVVFGTDRGAFGG